MPKRRPAARSGGTRERQTSTSSGVSHHPHAGRRECVFPLAGGSPCKRRPAARSGGTRERQTSTSSGVSRPPPRVCFPARGRVPMPKRRPAARSGGTRERGKHTRGGGRPTFQARGR